MAKGKFEKKWDKKCKYFNTVTLKCFYFFLFLKKKVRSTERVKEQLFPLIQSLKEMKSQALAHCSQLSGIAIPCWWCKNVVAQPENHPTASTCRGLDPGKGLQYVCSPFGTRKHRKLKYNFSEQMFSFHITLCKSIFCMILANLPVSQLPSSSF